MFVYEAFARTRDENHAFTSMVYGIEKKNQSKKGIAGLYQSSYTIE